MTAALARRPRPTMERPLLRDEARLAAREPSTCESFVISDPASWRRGHVPAITRGMSVGCIVAWGDGEGQGESVGGFDGSLFIIHCSFWGCSGETGRLWRASKDRIGWFGGGGRLRYAVAAFVLAVVAAFFLLRPSGGVSPVNAAAVVADPANVRTAVFAAGCFWGVQERFDHVKGVISTTAGYCGGNMENPTYEDVSGHGTGHAESVLVKYDQTKVSYAELLDAFWTMHDPTTKDQQGPDFGSNYRSVIFYADPEQEKVAKASRDEVQASGVFGGKIVTEIVPAAKFYPAEDYHQEYFSKNGGTCHNGVAKVRTKLAAEAKKVRESGVGTRPN